jgi:hypothetical protein
VIGCHKKGARQVPRPKRLKLIGEEGFFHITSRTVGQEFYLGDVEKEKLFDIIKYYSGYYFVKPIGITLIFFDCPLPSFLRVPSRLIKIEVLPSISFS